ncbi:MAG: CPBP family intramembrane metalloprotease [Planctomycetes bacterium]|nr:CPBP family intramembrane metalloprotease [Planctomycetota bacterium]
MEQQSELWLAVYVPCAGLASWWMLRCFAARPAQSPRQDGQDLAAIALGVLLASHLLRLFVRTVARDLPEPTPRLLGYVPLVLSSALLLWVGLARYRGVLGVRIEVREVVHALATYTLFFPLVLGLHWCNERAFANGAPAPRQETMVFLADASVWSRILVVTALVSLVPLSEELIFRGFLLRGLEGLAAAQFGAGATARWLALVGSALVFAGVHEHFAMLPVFGVGLILGWLTQRTGSITTACVFHALHNGVTVASSLGGWGA